MPVHDVFALVSHESRVFILEGLEGFGGQAFLDRRIEGVEACSDFDGLVFVWHASEEHEEELLDNAMNVAFDFGQACNRVVGVAESVGHCRSVHETQ